MENDSDDFTDDEKKECKITLELNYSLENPLDNKTAQVKKVQNTLIMPQDLRKSDKFFKRNIQTEECDVETRLLDKFKKSSLSSWKHYDGTLDDDVYTITAEDQSLPSSSLQITSIDGFFNRKRGRPPKNRFVEVYKNTHQKPQAIFTSFKLEKHGLTESAYNNSVSKCEQSSVLTSEDCEDDNKYSVANPRHIPGNENSTQHLKCFNRVNTILSTHGGDKNYAKTFIPMTDDEDVKSNDLSITESYNLSLNACTKPTKRNVSTGQCNGNQETSISLAFDSEPELKKLKSCGTADNVTVIRAAGTFYPENSRVNPCKDLKTKSSGIIKGKPSTLSLSGNEVAQNLSLHNRTQINATDDLKTSFSVSSLTAGSSSVLPQMYNVLQMQQQLFAFYQQMALMTPAFSHLAPALGHTSVIKEPPSSQLSCITSSDTEVDLFHSTHLINMILNLQKEPSSVEELTTDIKTDAHLRQIDKESTKTTKISNRSQNLITSYNNCCTPDQKIPERQIQYDRERTPSGYLRFRFNEDCRYENCGYRQHQSHFHCNRTDCQYSFCDKTRFVQHTARHDRLDTLMGTDFQQYRATMTCNYTHCPYVFNAVEGFHDIINSRKSSHFHCLKCPFVCADTNKVVAHRRLHSKMEFIRSAGFRKVSAKENCMIWTAAAANDFDKCAQFKTHVLSSDQKPLDHIGNKTVTTNCTYALRHAHYHCLVCNCSVLSRSQLFAHNHRESVTSTGTTQQQPLERNKSSPKNNSVCKESKL